MSDADSGRFGVAGQLAGDDPSVLLERLQLALTVAPLSIYECDRQLRYTGVMQAGSDAAVSARMLGRRDDELAVMADVGPLVALKLKALAEERLVRRVVELKFRGEPRVFDICVQPRYEQGVLAGLTIAALDVTALRAADKAVAENEALFRALAESLPQLVWSTRADGHADYFNRRWYDFSGAVPGELDGDGWSGLLHPDDVAPTLAVWRQALATGGGLDWEYRLRGADGEYRTFLVRGAAVLGPDGEVQRWFGSSTDIAELAQGREAMLLARDRLATAVAASAADLSEANQRLDAEIEERERAQEQLRQAQKMEAVGQLTGGIAHDFNNLLTVIVGNLETASRLLQAPGDPATNPRLGRALEQASGGAARAVALTRRLLAFARRQPLAPQAVDAGQLVTELLDMLRRTLGERVTVETAIGPNLPLVSIDPNQLESAIINLAVNARDAMPDGGRLSIAVADAGERRVRLTLTDTGTGMSAAVRERAFEPFYTTKPAGQGTGLGLAQVYGFVTQSGGTVEIDSALGRGTSIALTLPRYDGPPPDAAGAPAAAAGPLPPGLAVLVVEDDPGVRAHAVALLEEAGCAVAEAADAEAALRRLDAGPPVALLVSDIGLPGQDGIALATAARSRHPGLAVLLTTGHEGRLRGADPAAPPWPVLPKPFAREALLAAVARALAEPQGDAAERPAPARRVLVVEDDLLVRMFAVDALEEAGWATGEAANAAQARAALAEAPYDLAILDVGLPDQRGDALALDLLAGNERLLVLMASGYGEANMPKALTSHPRVGFIDKPYDALMLVDALESALLRQGA